MELLIDELVVGLLNFGIDHFQRLGVGVHWLAVGRALTDIAIAPTLGHLDGLHISQRRSLLLGLESRVVRRRVHLILYVLVANRRRFPRLSPRRRLPPVRSALVLQLLNLILDGLLMAPEQIVLLLRREQALVVLGALLLLRVAPLLGREGRMDCLRHDLGPDVLLAVIGGHWLREVGVVHVRVLRPRGRRVLPEVLVRVVFNADGPVVADLVRQLSLGPRALARCRMFRARSVRAPLRALSVRGHARVLVAERVVQVGLPRRVLLVGMVVLQRGSLSFVLLLVALDALGGWSLLLGRAHSKHGASASSLGTRRHWRKLVGLVHVGVFRLRIVTSLRVFISLLALVEDALVLLILVLREGATLAALAHGSLVNELRHVIWEFLERYWC